MGPIERPCDPVRLRALFDQLFVQLTEFPSDEEHKVEQVLEGGEFLVALENLTTQLYELAVPLSDAAGVTIRELAAATGLERRYTDLLDL